MTSRTVAASIRAHALFVGIVACACAATGAARACERWDLSGHVVVQQSNGIRVVAELQQSDTTLTGTARFYSHTLDPERQVLITGTLDRGSVTGDAVRFDVLWLTDWQRTKEFLGDTYLIPEVYKATGVYEGTISATGRVEGINFETRNPQGKVTWHLRDPAKCARALPPPAPPREPVRAGMQDDTDRPGADYFRFVLEGRDPEACQVACTSAKGRCRAWTYVRPGVQGPRAVCYLKHTVPAPASNACCISGAPPSRTSPEALRERSHLPVGG